MRRSEDGTTNFLAVPPMDKKGTRKISHRETRAGWGFTLMKSQQGRDETPTVEACGPVQTIEGGEHAVGATRATNNTAEMQALIETLCWLNTSAEHKGLPSSGKVMITVDPLYVKGLIDEKFVEKENRTLATLLCHLWKVTQKKLKLQIRWPHRRRG